MLAFLSLPSVMYTLPVEPPHNFLMTANLTAKQRDSQLDQGTHQNDHFCVHRVQERDDGYQVSGEEVPETPYLPLKWGWCILRIYSMRVFS